MPGVGGQTLRSAALPVVAGPALGGKAVGAARHDDQGAGDGGKAWPAAARAAAGQGPHP